MADRAVRMSRKEDGDIVALCNDSESWSPRLRDDVIQDIETGAHTYYVPWTDGRTEVHVVHDPNGTYLRTDRGDPFENSLNDLPDG